jgi:hypothetical protein
VAASFSCVILLPRFDWRFDFILLVVLRQNDVTSINEIQNARSRSWPKVSVVTSVVPIALQNADALETRFSKAEIPQV